MEFGYIRLEGNNKPLNNNTIYIQAAGLFYVSIVTRHGISVAANILSRKQ